MNHRIALVCAALLFGCHTRVTSTATGTQAATTGAGGASTVATTSSANTTGTFSSGSGLTGCANPQAQLPWVVSDVQDTYYNLLYTFDPAKKDFSPVWTLNCKGSGSLNSIAISRDRVGYYAYNEMAGDALYTSDLANKSDCTLLMSIPKSFGVKTMAFVSDTPGGDAETLYLSGANGALAKIDLQNKVFTPIGSWTGDATVATLPAMLAGRGDGALYGLFTTMPDVHVAELDTSAHVVANNAMTGMAPDHVVAFTMLGGKQYVFTTPTRGLCGYPPEPCSDSDVAEYDPATKTLNPGFMMDIGFPVVSASVTTCAKQM